MPQSAATAAAYTHTDTAALLSLLHPPDAGGRLELRAHHHGAWRKRWPLSIEAAVAIARDEIARGADVYAGVLPRHGSQGPDQTRYRAAAIVWADLDTDDALQALGNFGSQPTLTVASGGRTANGQDKAHCYWKLGAPLEPAWVVKANRRLSHHLHADPASTDQGRILRLPGSTSAKPGAKPARIVDATGEVHDIRALVGDLPDPPGGAHGAPILPTDARNPRVPIGHRHAATVRFLGLLRSAGFGPDQLQIFADAFIEHCCQHDPAKPVQGLDKTVDWIARRPDERNNRPAA